MRGRPGTPRPAGLAEVRGRGGGAVVGASARGGAPVVASLRRRRRATEPCTSRRGDLPTAQQKGVRPTASAATCSARAYERVQQAAEWSWWKWR